MTNGVEMTHAVHQSTSRSTRSTSFAMHVVLCGATISVKRTDGDNETASSNGPVAVPAIWQALVIF